jgi:hypothetical protein
LETLRIDAADSIELHALLDQAKSNLKRDILQLLTTGDRLYQES